MGSPLAMCRNGHVTPVVGIEMGADIDGFSFGGGSTICGVCGEQADFLAGSYSSDARGAVTARLNLTPSQLHRLKQSLRFAELEMSKHEPDRERAVRVLERTIEENAPAVKTVLDRMRDPLVGHSAAWVAVLIAIMIWLTQGGADGATAEDVQRIADETARSVLHEQAEKDSTSSEVPASNSPPREQPPTVTELPTPKTH